MPSRQDSLGVGLQLQPTGFHWLPPQASAFEGFCFLLFEGFSFLLLEGFSSHASAENGMPLEGFSFGRLASTEVLRQVGTHAAQGLPFCTLSNNLHMFCLPLWAMNDGDADDNAADARDVSLKGGCLIPFVAGLCC